MTSVTSTLAFLFLIMAASGVSFASDPSANPNETRAIQWLQEQVEFLACDEMHHVYGVGYIDGSYMERIFLVADDHGLPRVEAEFREENLTWNSTDSDLEPRSFIIELKVPRARYAQKSITGWTVGSDGWQSALRFKYTTWFGLIGRVNGHWQVEWQGYRRPMLPADLRDEGEKVCSWFGLGNP